MNSELTNQSVVVIGGTSGMGLAIARLAASRGAYVTVASRSPDKVAAAASELGVTGQPLDTTNEASVREFFLSSRPVLFVRARSRILHSRTVSSRSAASFSARISAPNTPR